MRAAAPTSLFRKRSNPPDQAGTSRVREVVEIAVAVHKNRNMRAISGRTMPTPTFPVTTDRGAKMQQVRRAGATRYRPVAGNLNCHNWYRVSGRNTLRFVYCPHSARHSLSWRTHSCGRGPPRSATLRIHASRPARQASSQAEGGGLAGPDGGDGSKSIGASSDWTAAIGLNVDVPVVPPHRMPASVPRVGGVPVPGVIAITGAPLSPEAETAEKSV